MKKIFNLTLVLGTLLAVGLACNFTTANLSDITFAKDQDGDKTIKSIEQGEKFFALTSLNNASGKHKVKWEVLDKSGEEIELPENEIEVDGSRKLWLTLTVPQNASAGKYKFKVILLDEKGEKEIDKKTGTLTVKGDKSNSDESDGEDSDSEESDAENEE